MDSHLLSKAVQYHGPELIRHMQIEQQPVPPSTLDYLHKYKQRDLHNNQNDEFQQKVKNFIAKKADFLFRTLESNLGATSAIDDEDSYAKMPPLETFMGVDLSLCRSHFYNSLEKRDIVVGVVSSVSESGIVLMLLCMDNGKARDIDDYRISAFCPAKELPRQFLHQNPIENFQVKDKVRGVVLSVNSENEKIIISLLERNLPENVDLKLGLLNQDEFPVHYRRKLHIRGLTFDELMHSILGFNNAGNTKCLLDVLGQSEDASLMRGLHNLQIPEKEMCESLRKQQSEKWAHSSVAQGISLFKSGKFMEAIQHLNRALQIDSTNVEALVARGALYANNESYIKAIEDFEAALAINSQHKNALKYMIETLLAQGRVYEDQGRYEDSEAYYNQALSIDSECVEAREALRYMYYKKSREENERLGGKFRGPMLDEQRMSSTKDRSPAERSAMSLKNLIDEEKQEQRDFPRRKRYCSEDMNPERDIKQRKQSPDDESRKLSPQLYDMTKDHVQYGGFNWDRYDQPDSRVPYRDGREQYIHGKSPSREFNVNLQASFFQNTGGVAQFVLPGLDLDPVDAFKSERKQEIPDLPRNVHEDNDYSELYGRTIDKDEDQPSRDIYKGNDSRHWYEEEEETKFYGRNIDNFSSNIIKKEYVRSPTQDMRERPIKQEVSSERFFENEASHKSPKKERSSSFDVDSYSEKKSSKKNKGKYSPKENLEISERVSKENFEKRSSKRDSKEREYEKVSKQKKEERLKSESPEDRRKQRSHSPREKKKKSISKEQHKKESRPLKDSRERSRSKSPKYRKRSSRSPENRKRRSKSPSDKKKKVQSESRSKGKSKSPSSGKGKYRSSSNRRSKSPSGHRGRSRSPSDHKKKPDLKKEKVEEKKLKSEHKSNLNRSPESRNKKDGVNKTKHTDKQEKIIKESERNKEKGSKSPKTSKFTEKNWESVVKEKAVPEQQALTEKSPLPELTKIQKQSRFSNIEERSSKSPSIAKPVKEPEDSTLISQVRSRWDSPGDETYYKEITINSPRQASKSKPSKKEGIKMIPRSLEVKLDKKVQKKKDTINEKGSKESSESRKRQRSTSPRRQEKSIQKSSDNSRKRDELPTKGREEQKSYRNSKNSKADPQSPFSKIEQRVMQSKQTGMRVKTPSPFSQLEDEIFGGDEPQQKDKGGEEDNIWDDVLSMDDEKKDISEVNIDAKEKDLKQRVEMHFKHTGNMISPPVRQQEGSQRKETEQRDRSRKRSRSSSRRKEIERRDRSPRKRSWSPRTMSQSPRNRSPVMRREQRADSREFEGIRVHIRNDKYLSPTRREGIQNAGGDIPVSIFHVASKPQLIRNRSPVEQSKQKTNEVKLQGGKTDIKKSNAQLGLSGDNQEVSTLDQKNMTEKGKDKLSKSDSKTQKSSSKSHRKNSRSPHRKGSHSPRRKYSRSPRRRKSRSPRRSGSRSPLTKRDGRSHDREPRFRGKNKRFSGEFNRGRYNRGRGARGRNRGQGRFRRNTDASSNSPELQKEWTTSSGIVIRDRKDNEKSLRSESGKLSDPTNVSDEPFVSIPKGPQGQFRNVFRSPRSRSFSSSRSRSRSRSRGRQRFSGRAKRHSGSGERKPGSRRKSGNRFDRWNKSSDSSSSSRSPSPSGEILKSSNQNEGDLSAKEEENSLEANISNIKSKENKETLIMLESFLQQLKEKKKKETVPDGKPKKK